MQLHDQMDGPGATGGGISVSDILGIASRQKWVIIGTTLVLTLAVVVFLKALPNRYTATSTVMVDSRVKTVTNIGRVVDGLRVDTPAIESQVEIVASRDVALRVIEKLGLRRDREFAGDDAAARTPAGKERAVSVPGPAARDYVLAAFRSALEVNRIRNSHVIEVNFTSKSRAKSAKIANAIVTAHIELELEQKIQQSELASQFLADKLESLRNKLAVAEGKVQRFRAQNNLFDADGRPLSEKQLARLMEQTILARNTTAEARSRYEQVNKMMRSGKPKGAIADVLKSHTVRMLKDQQAKLAGRAAELAIKYGQLHPTMQKANAELRDIERQVNHEVDQILFNLKNEYEVARAREEKLAASYAKLEQQLGRKGQANVQLKELERDADSTRQLYEAILSRFKQTTETQAMQLPDSRVVEAATVPLLPSSPKRKKLSFIGSIAALGLALVAALAMEFRQNGFAFGRAKQRIVEIDQLSTLPLAEAVGIDDQSNVSAMRLMISHPESAFADAVRGIGYVLDDINESKGRQSSQSGFSGQEPASPQPNSTQVILVASSLPREGRTMVASNLAHHYALNGAKTLLIDADLRKAGLTEILAPGAHAGLADCLVSGVPSTVAILRDASTGLNFLPARSHRPLQVNASDILTMPQLDKTLQQLRGSFNTIVIDSSPVLPVVDARLLADHADQLLLVMAWHRTPKELAKRSIRLFGRNAHKIAGVVANRMVPQRLGENAAQQHNSPHSAGRRAIHKGVDDCDRYAA